MLGLHCLGTTYHNMELYLVGMIRYKLYFKFSTKYVTIILIKQVYYEPIFYRSVGFQLIGLERMFFQNYIVDFSLEELKSQTSTLPCDFQPLVLEILFKIARGIFSRYFRVTYYVTNINRAHLGL
eukprot:TRINITY_DN2241_c0_g1_i3.p4 TRINITY_DN2241_c0_g1~~TRINITY_DN2241_c0_g1_i3.p4  ORF type:complete len:125 (+),score=0.88 TRINITY_DN2241_c0_g1_i3:353-727(+)